MVVVVVVAVVVVVVAAFDCFDDEACFGVVDAFCFCCLCTF